MTLQDVGWNDVLRNAFAAHRDAGLLPARVVAQHRDRWSLIGELGELDGMVEGRFRSEASDAARLPAVGDWLAVQPLPGEDKAVIRAILPRTSCFTRKAPGEATAEQVVAANLDHVLLVNGLDGDFNLRRLERYLTLAYDSGAPPVIVLNKADLCADLEAALAAVEAVAFGAPIHPVSALRGDGVDGLRRYLAGGQTVALLGSSGVGKSALTNALAGAERQATGAVRADDSRGRHTTTHRELIALPGGGCVIDTPGMRELQLWADAEQVDRTFGDIARLAAECRFRDCTHDHEPGCAVQAELADGRLDPARFGSYLKQQREVAALEARRDKQRHEQKAFGKMARRVLKEKRQREGW